MAEEWDKERNGKQTPWKVRPLATEKAWWRCPHCDRPYRLAIRSKVISNSGCPYCGYGGKRAQVSLPVIRLDTLKSYPTISSAQREVGYSLKTAINKSKLDRNGIAWCYLIDYELGRIPDFTKGNQVTPVICLETGKRFETQSQAEIELGISRGSICRALNTGKTAKGYHWIRESEYSEEKAAAARAESAPYRVVCLETGTRYKTYADAGRDLGVEEGNIQQAVKSKSHYSRGYHFVNSDEYSTLAKGEIENILKGDGRSRTVVCVETGKRYESIKAATREYGDRQKSARSGIGRCCKNPYRTFDGKHWCYPDDLESRIDNAEEYTVPRKTAIRCLETGKMYESIADASRDTGINNNSIRAVARGDRHKAGGYTWEYVNPAPDKRDNRGCNQPTAKKVRCAETGNQFVSLSDAARAVGLRNGNSIRRAIDRGGTAGGYHWEYLDEKKEVSTDDHHQADGRAE
ncbi:hypothetical protein G4381_15135 [Coprococcus comes]|nr:hypothetical protein [Coprococcus comes]